jgi:hypothetical protein
MYSVIELVLSGHQTLGPDPSTIKKKKKKKFVPSPLWSTDI